MDSQCPVTERRACHLILHCGLPAYFRQEAHQEKTETQLGLQIQKQLKGQGQVEKEQHERFTYSRYFATPSNQDLRIYPRAVQLASSQGTRRTACVANSSGLDVGFSCAIRATASKRSLSCRRSGSSPRCVSSKVMASSFFPN